MEVIQALYAAISEYSRSAPKIVELEIRRTI